MTIDGRSYDSARCRWFAFQVVRRAQAGDLDVITTNRMAIEDTVILWHVKFTDKGTATKGLNIAMTTDIG
jgi:hypothetical protein